MTVSEYSPGAAVPVETVIVEEPEFAIEVGLKDAVAPAGKPLTLRARLPTKPVPPVAVTVYGTFAPWVTELRLGDAVRVKSGTVMVRDGG